MKPRTLILTLAAAVLLALPTAVAAQQHGPGDCDGTGPHGPGRMAGPGGPDGPGGLGGPGGRGFLRMLPRFADKLDLSDAQLAEIEAIVDARKPELEALHDQASAAREAFRDAHQIGDFDEAEFRAHFSSQAQLHVEMRLIGAEMTSQVWNVLTPEQQQELTELLELLGPPGKKDAGPRHGGGKRFRP